MPKKLSPPATKEDIRLLMDSIGKLYEANERWKMEIIDDLSKRTDARFIASEQRMIRELHVVIEQHAYDIQGACFDKLSLHDDRLARLEQRVGLR